MPKGVDFFLATQKKKKEDTSRLFFIPPSPWLLKKGPVAGPAEYQKIKCLCLK